MLHNLIVAIGYLSTTTTAANGTAFPGSKTDTAVYTTASVDTLASGLATKEPVLSDHSTSSIYFVNTTMVAGLEYTTITCSEPTTFTYNNHTYSITLPTTLTTGSIESSRRPESNNTALIIDTESPGLETLGTSMPPTFGTSASQLLETSQPQYPKPSSSQLFKTAYATASASTFSSSPRSTADSSSSEVNGAAKLPRIYTLAVVFVLLL